MFHILKKKPSRASPSQAGVLAHRTYFAEFLIQTVLYIQGPKAKIYVRSVKMDIALMPNER